MERLEKFADAIQAGRASRSARSTRSTSTQEVDRFRTVYNQAWEHNWGFVPMTDEEIVHMAKSLKPVIDPEIVLFLEKEAKPRRFRPRRFPT